MRRTFSDGFDLDSEFEQALRGANRSLWRFEQQPAYAIGDESRLLADFRAGIHTPPTTEPDFRAWYAQVRAQVRDGMRIGRLRVVDQPPTDYQRWLQFIDRWNSEAGEEIYYLPRRALASYPALRHPPFGDADWWLLDDRLALIMHFDSAGARTKVELSDERYELAAAARFRHRAENIAREIAKATAARAA